jgi:hypothetical protein
MAGIGWVWHGALAELDATFDRSAVVGDDQDLPVEALTMLQLGLAAGYRGAYGIEAAATLARSRILLRYDDDDYDLERDAWTIGLRGAKTWHIGHGWAAGFELAAELSLLERILQDQERPLVWTYRLRGVLVPD